MKDKVTNFLKQNKNISIIILFIILITIIKHTLVSNFPILPLTGAGEDDALMVKWAYSILDGKWLGEYQYNTLMKGPVFPLLLTKLYKYNIKYLFFITLFYTVSCILFIFSIRKLIKNKYLIIPIYLIILLNPIMYSTEVFQRVYRNSLIPSFALLIPACYFGMYLNRNEKVYKYIFWSLVASISLPLFYYTREDSMWIVPFIIFMMFTIIITSIIKVLKEKKNIISFFAKIVFLILPIITFMAFGEKIAKKNESIYGLKTKNVLSDSYFKDALDAIYAVKPENNIEGVTLTQEKARRIASVSTSFNSMYPFVVEMLGGYGALDRIPEDGECEDGWILWALRSAANKAGYDTLEKEQELYKKIAEEINNAMDKGLLQRQMTMPSPLLSPYQKGYAFKTMKSFLKGLIYISTFKDITITNSDIVEKRSDAYNAVKKFEVISHERALYFEDTTVDGIKIDELKDQEEYINSLENKKNILNGFTKGYSVIGIILLIVGPVSYIILTIKMIKSIIKKDYYYNEKWFIASGILGAFFTLLAGVSYNEVATAYSLKVLYLCGTYPLFLAFGIITFCMILEKRLELLDEKQNNSIEEEK